MSKKRVSRGIVKPEKFSQFFSRFTRSFIKHDRPIKSKLIQKLRELDSRIKPILIWNSREQGTYRRPLND